MALNANALLTVEDAKGFLSIPSADTDFDTDVESVVNALSDLFCRIANRDTFVSSAITEYTEGKDDDTIWLRNPPITETTSSVFIWIDEERLYPDSAKLARTDFVVYPQTGKVVLVDDVFYSYPRCVKVTYYGGYSTLPGDLTWAAKLALAYLWKMKERVGVTSVGQAQGGTTSYEDIDDEWGLPKAVTAIVKRFRRWSI